MPNIEKTRLKHKTTEVELIDCYRLTVHRQIPQLLDLKSDIHLLSVIILQFAYLFNAFLLSLTKLRIPIIYSDEPINDITVAMRFGGAILYPYCIEAIHGKTYSIHANAE